MKAVEIKNLFWKYGGRKDYALKGINLEIEENRFIGVIGPNESGKTSLVNVIKGIIPENYTGIYKGEVKVFGETVIAQGPRSMARAVGMVFADPDSQFNSMSVEEELSFGLENIGCSVEEIKRRLEWVDSLTHIGNLIEKPPYSLSGGQKQRVAIASVLVLQPKIIILDEPMSMLDPISKDMIFDLLHTMKEELKVTVIVVEHNIENLVELADEIILMSDGKIEKHTSTAEFFNDPSFMENRNIRIPGALKFISMVKKDRKEKGNIPIKFQDILDTLKDYLKNGRSQW